MKTPLWRRLAANRPLFAVLALLQAALIFYLSGKDWSGGGPKLPWRVGNLFHIPVFGTLAAFLALALGVAARPQQPGILWRVVCLTAIYGLSDEIHQSFRPGRTCSLMDLLVDTFSAVGFSAVLLLVFDGDQRRRHSWQSLGFLSLAAWTAVFGAETFPAADQVLVDVIDRLKR